ncbi:peptide chain release factor N(5)-glutamine methyltransferase [Soonwooa sp.]|uniref:peptide chain release factor N(5)-glutamine methyltransferase n=2 Tax=Soonwooa sp. TaxID=1938592 RepID=UPI0028A72172|nr:peptide chain release factor N(5)-glutamine methyltransferase [Soonwooa sp.]
MTISDLKKRFQNELSEQYSTSESIILFYIFADKIFGFKRYEDYKFENQELLNADKETFDSILEDLKSGKPYQQITGETEFYGKLFKVNEHVLIPRPETEELLELASHYIKEFQKENAIQNLKILDIGTGSGIIPIILKLNFPDAEVHALDVSEEALEIAKQNAALHEVDIQIHKKDILNESPEDVYDIIISNPPYIGIEENINIEDSVKSFEPNLALFSPTEDVLIFYKRIAELGKSHLKEKGLIFLEINQKYGPETLELYREFKVSKLIKDLSDNDRMIYVKK